MSLTVTYKLLYKTSTLAKRK